MVFALIKIPYRFDNISARANDRVSAAVHIASHTTRGVKTRALNPNFPTHGRKVETVTQREKKPGDRPSNTP